MIKNELKELMNDIHIKKMKSLISGLLGEPISVLMENNIDSVSFMNKINEELLGAVKVIFKENLELREHDLDNKHYFGFYLGDELIFEYGYYTDKEDKTEHKLLN